MKVIMKGGDEIWNIDQMDLDNDEYNEWRKEEFLDVVEEVLNDYVGVGVWVSDEVGRVCVEKYEAMMINKQLIEFKIEMIRVIDEWMEW